MTVTISRLALLSAMLLVLLLTGCRHMVPSDGGLTRTPVANDDVTLRAVLAYARQQADADSAQRARTIKAIEADTVTPLNLMKLAVIHGQNRNEADPAKGAALLEKVLADKSAEAVTLHPLARILHAQYLARVRLQGQNERLLSETKSAQAREDELQEKLDALTDIERSLRTPTR